MTAALIGPQFSPRHPNAAKAMANWERKSSYLLREIVKFRTYMDSLATAQSQKEKIYTDREAAEAVRSQSAAPEAASSSAEASGGAKAVQSPGGSADDGANALQPRSPEPGASVASTD